MRNVMSSVMTTTCDAVDLSLPSCEGCDSDGSLSWEDFYGSVASEDLESTLLGMYDALVGRANTNTPEEVLPPRPPRRSNAPVKVQRRWNCRCTDKASSLVVTRCGSCIADLRSTDIRDSMVLEPTTSPPPQRRASLASPELSCSLLTCPASPVVRQARTPEPEKSQFETIQLPSAQEERPSTPAENKCQLLSSSPKKDRSPKITTPAVSPLALKRLRAENGVSRPESVSSIVSSSSSSSGGSLTRLAAPLKSAYLASVESLEDVCETERRKSGCTRTVESDWFKCNESQGSADSGVHSSCSNSPVRARFHDPHLSYMDRVVMEIIETEQIYVKDLQAIIEGYLHHWRTEPDFPIADRLPELFGNLEDIYHFNSSFLRDLEKCSLDPVKVARCFVSNNEGFSVYTEYCTNYPRTVSLLTELMRLDGIVRLFRERQTALNQTLPLGSYLLKPVQRILKYHLLLQNIVKQSVKDVVGYADMEDALAAMTGIAQHINDMKRRHEHAVRVQEIQSLLHGWPGEDLTTLGELCAEGTFRMSGAKALRHIFLFDKCLLITKKKEQGLLGYKTHIDCSNLMLIESVPGEPLSFHVIPFDNPKLQYTLQARNLEQKREWTLQIKRVILENYNAVIPSHARQLVMELGQIRSDGSASDRTITRKQHSAPEYLERRKQDRRKADAGFRARLRKSRKSDAGSNSQSQLTKAAERNNVPPRRRQSEPAPLSIEASFSDSISTVNESLKDSAPSMDQVSIDLSDSEEVRSIEQIVGQLLMQNREFEKILKRQKHQMNLRRRQKADQLCETTDDDEDGIYETLLNINLMIAKDNTDDSDADYVMLLPTANGICPDNFTPLSSHCSSVCEVNVEDSALVRMPSAPTSTLVWLQQQGQHLATPTKKAGSLPRSFQMNVEGTENAFKDARSSIERPFTIASDQPNPMLYDQDYRPPLPLPGSVEDESMTEFGSTPGASMDRIDMHPVNKIYRSGVAHNTLKQTLSSVGNRLAHLTMDLTPDSHKTLQWEKKASRLVSILARQCRKSLKNRVRNACSFQDVTTPTLPIFMQGSSHLGARLAHNTSGFERVRPKAAAVLGLEPDSFVPLSSSLCSVLSSRDDLVPGDNASLMEGGNEESDASFDSFYERSFDAFDDLHPQNSDDPDERFTDDEQKKSEEESDDHNGNLGQKPSAIPENSQVRVLVGGVEEEVFKRSKSIRERQRELEQWRLAQETKEASAKDSENIRPKGWVRKVVEKLQAENDLVMLGPLPNVPEL